MGEISDNFRGLFNLNPANRIHAIMSTAFRLAPDLLSSGTRPYDIERLDVSVAFGSRVLCRRLYYRLVIIFRHFVSWREDGIQKAGKSGHHMAVSDILFPFHHLVNHNKCL